jgi:hypothetical protein
MKLPITTTGLATISVSMAALLVVLLGVNAHAATRLVVAFGGYSGSSCVHDRYDIMLAGSEAEIVLKVMEGPEHGGYQGLPDGPPEGLKFRASLGSVRGDTSTASPRLLEQIHPTFYVSVFQELIEGGFKASGRVSESNASPEYHFLIDVPEALAAQHLCISVDLDDPRFGRLHGFACTPVVAPCNSEDRNTMLASYVAMAFDSRNYQLAAGLADSLLSTGWRSELGLEKGRSAARRLHLYDQELRFLDAQYGAYGTVSPGMTRTAEQNKLEYERERAKIVKHIDEESSESK